MESQGLGWGVLEPTFIGQGLQKGILSRGLTASCASPPIPAFLTLGRAEDTQTLPTLLSGPAHPLPKKILHAASQVYTQAELQVTY
jgi:hypothetical protein